MRNSSQHTQYTTYGYDILFNGKFQRVIPPGIDLKIDNDVAAGTFLGSLFHDLIALA